MLWEFWIYNVYRRILGRVLVGNIVNIRNECLIFLGSWGMNRSAEQTNRARTASRFTRFVCLALRFIPHEPRKKDTHSLNEQGVFVRQWCISLGVKNSYFQSKGQSTWFQCHAKGFIRGLNMPKVKYIFWSKSSGKRSKLNCHKVSLINRKINVTEFDEDISSLHSQHTKYC